MSDPKEIALYLQIGVYTIGIIGGVAGGVRYLYGRRRESIAGLRTSLLRKWTNESEIRLSDYRFLTLRLQVFQGELIGRLDYTSEDRPFDCFARLKWGHAILMVSKNLNPIGEVRLRLGGSNNNRIKWKVLAEEQKGVLPKNTILWPGREEVSTIVDGSRKSRTKHRTIIR